MLSAHGGKGPARAHGWTHLLLAASVAAALLGWIVTASSLAASRPQIGEVSSEGGEPHSAEVHFQVRPEGSQTDYSIQLATEAGWKLEGKGTIPANRLEVEVSQEVTELLPEQTYYFYVYATNAVGTDSAHGIIETSPEPPDTGLGNGSGAGKPVELEEAPWVREGGERAVPKHRFAKPNGKPKRHDAHRKQRRRRRRRRHMNVNCANRETRRSGSRGTRGARTIRGGSPSGEVRRAETQG